MPFAYFSRLSRTHQRIYLASAGVRAVPLPAAGAAAAAAAARGPALAAAAPARVAGRSAAVAARHGRLLAVPPAAVRLLGARPSRSWGELHGLYEPAYTPPRITLWMRTAQRHQVVAFRTFLRTLLHELLHHLDYEWLKLRESFHTEGFYQRESSLLKQVLPEP